MAIAWAAQYIPGVETQDNVKIGNQAIDHYQRVLDSDAPRKSKINSANGVAYLYLNMKKFDDAQYYQTASGFDPKDPEPHYSIGVINRTACYQPRMEARAKLGLRPEEKEEA